MERSGGARELGTLPELPPESSYLARFARERASVVVGDALLPNGGGSVTFRWSDELGMQRVTPAGKSSSPGYASADGTTLVGHVNDAGGTILEQLPLDGARGLERRSGHRAERRRARRRRAGRSPLER